MNTWCSRSEFCVSGGGPAGGSERTAASSRDALIPPNIPACFSGISTATPPVAGFTTLIRLRSPRRSGASRYPVSRR